MILGLTAPLPGKRCCYYRFLVVVVNEGLWFDEWPANLRVKVLALDPSKGGDSLHGDYSAFISLGIDRQGILYVQADLARRPTPQMVADGVELYRKFRPHIFGVEAK